MCFYYREETDTTYVNIYNNTITTKDRKDLAAAINGAYGGNFAKFETKEEADWVSSRISDYHTVMGIQPNENGELLWYDGTPVGDFLLNDRKIYSGYLALSNTAFKILFGPGIDLFKHGRKRIRKICIETINRVIKRNLTAHEAGTDNTDLFHIRKFHFE